jgi:hypothetical protein
MWGRGKKSLRDFFPLPPPNRSPVISIRQLAERNLFHHVITSLCPKTLGELSKRQNWTSGSRKNKQRTTNNEQQTTNNKQRTTNNEQQTTNNEQRTTNKKPPAFRQRVFLIRISIKPI